jgi:hypothetical protein
MHLTFLGAGVVTMPLALGASRGQATPVDLYVLHAVINVAE